MNSPKALILAAGVGSRLAPLTDTIPKSMVPVNGKPILFQQLDCLLTNGIRNITLVTGYLSDVLQARVHSQYPQVTFIHSPNYASTNNMVSAYLCREIFAHQDFLMMNADVFFDPTVIDDLLRSPFPNAIVTDIGAYNQESMKVCVQAGRITRIAKDITPEEAYGTSIDVYKFSAQASSAFFSRCAYYIETLGQLNRWSEVALSDCFQNCVFTPCPLRGRWIEIDTPEDLQTAERLFH